MRIRARLAALGEAVIPHAGQEVGENEVVMGGEGAGLGELDEDGEGAGLGELDGDGEGAGLGELDGDGEGDGDGHEVGHDEDCLPGGEGLNGEDEELAAEMLESFLEARDDEDFEVLLENWGEEGGEPDAEALHLDCQPEPTAVLNVTNRHKRPRRCQRNLTSICR